MLHVGDVPRIDPKTWSLAFTGLVDNPYTIGYDELRALPSTEYRGDIHCVTRWSKQNTYWRGTLFRTLLERARPHASATHAIQYADNDYTTNLPLAAMLDDDVLIAWEYDGQPIDEKGFWEVRGYNNNADPWKEERYSDLPSWMG